MTEIPTLPPYSPHAWKCRKRLVVVEAIQWDAQMIANQGLVARPMERIKAAEGGMAKTFIRRRPRPKPGKVA
jgi:hypothetical protein